MGFSRHDVLGLPHRRRPASRLGSNRRLNETGRVMVRTVISGTCSMLARVRWRRAFAFNVFFLASAGVGAQPMRVAGLADLSIEELGKSHITAVSRPAEGLSDPPPSVFANSARGLLPARPP